MLFSGWLLGSPPGRGAGPAMPQGLLFNLQHPYDGAIVGRRPNSHLSSQFPQRLLVELKSV